MTSKAARSAAAAGGTRLKVLRAEAMGFCFGVRDAVDAAARITDPRDVTIHGELVHNE